MKNFQIGWVFILAILFSACSGGITQRYTDQQGHWVPVKDSSGTIIGNTLAYDSVYKIEPSFSGKVKIASHNGTGITAVLLLIMAVVLIIRGILYGNNAGKWSGLPVILFCAAILSAAAALSTINWAATKEVEIPKVLYDSLQNKPDGLKPFWDENLLK